jgi:putative sterol carrier protein
MADLTVPKIFENMQERMTADPAKVAGINAIYQFNITGDGGGEWFVDLTQPAPAITKGSAPAANCTVTIAEPDFIGIVTGQLNAQMAFMTGKVRIGGDMGLAMKLGKILG